MSGFQISARSGQLLYVEVEVPNVGEIVSGIEASTVLARQTTLQAVQSAVGELPEPLDASATHSAVAAALAAYDPPTRAEAVADVAQLLAAISGAGVWSEQQRDTVLSILAANGIDGHTLTEALRLILSAQVGDVSGAGVPGGVIQISSPVGAPVRIEAEVDGRGNRTIISRNAAP